MLSSFEVIFLQGCLPVRFSSFEVVNLWESLPVGVSSMPDPHDKEEQSLYGLDFKLQNYFGRAGIFCIFILSTILLSQHPW